MFGGVSRSSNQIRLGETTARGQHVETRRRKPDGLDMCVCIGFFFFSSRRRHTRFSRDWSSDVCSSDLAAAEVERLLGVEPGDPGMLVVGRAEAALRLALLVVLVDLIDLEHRERTAARSEERRVGKECRARWST